MPESEFRIRGDIITGSAEASQSASAIERLA
jgi:hypothetical protein